MHAFVRHSLGIIALVALAVGVPGGEALASGSPQARCVIVNAGAVTGEIQLGGRVIFRIRGEAGGYDTVSRCEMVSRRLNRLIREEVAGEARPGVVDGEVVVVAQGHVIATVTETAADANGTSRSMLAWIWANQLRQALGVSPLSIGAVPTQGVSGMQEMIASWYGAELAGRSTASGEPFDPDDLTAAHKTLPFGTRLWVVEPRSGKQVVVRINDRGPWARGRDLDLSRAAARELGILGSGVQTIYVEILDTQLAAR